MESTYAAGVGVGATPVAARPHAALRHAVDSQTNLCIPFSAPGMTIRERWCDKSDLVGITLLCRVYYALTLLSSVPRLTSAQPRQEFVEIHMGLPVRIVAYAPDNLARP